MKRFFFKRRRRSRRVRDGLETWWYLKLPLHKKNTYLYVVPPPELNHPAHELALLQIRARLVHELAHVLASPRHFSAE
jgi:hypothetical protein